MQRFFTDSYQSIRPSGLGPGRGRGRSSMNLAVLHGQRGTMSMPTSPVGRMANDWGEMPQSAQAYFGAQHTSGETQQYGALPTAKEDSFDYPFISPVGFDGMQDQDSSTSGGRDRKKRAQVRIACTHCQRACKKCSNTRPCERCVKYNLKDCVDSVRKPRKSGIKRGPYKRRASSKYHHTQSSGTMPAQSAPASAHGSQVYTPPAAAFLSGPQWINGQRVHGPPRPEPLYPDTQLLDHFPLSLHSQDDPFSRAVSPIKQDRLESHFLPGSEPQEPVAIDPYPHQPLFHSPQQETSPRDHDPDWAALRNVLQRSLPHVQGRPESPAHIALKKIRKPSFRTLMSTGGSQAGSRQVSPVLESPTLFDQPMELDQEMDVGIGMEEPDGSDISPTSGMWTGRQDQRGVSEPGLGLMGFEGLMGYQNNH